ncbi:FAD-dependent oxidoreductase [Candidatus Methylocalor cossyra]|uniref:D-amino-acid oxidase n=1 Tax=Candidatus Methylocalor cossyra TaxID=3108543 RepID=A0ABM9NL27_9GAMM
MPSDFAVLGAGLMGRLVAGELAQAGHRVHLYERGGPDGQGSAAHVAAAMLAPLAEAVASEPIVARLGLAALERWPALLRALPESVFFQREGTLVLWHGPDRDQAAQFVARLRALGPELLRQAPPEELAGPDIEALEPALGQRFARGIYLPGEGQLDNRALLTALRHRLEALGVRLHWGAEVTPERLAADWIVDCRGLGAKPEWRALRGVRGEVLRVQADEVQLRRPIRLLHPRYPIYIAPKPDGVYVVGATQIETEDMSPVSVRSALELLSALYSVHPAFGEARILELSRQCRPALPHNLPEIRWDGARLIQINGLYRHGFLVAPALLEAALALIQRLLEVGAAELCAWRDAQPWAALYRWNEPQPS